ncbi:MAG: serine/threonine-protein kinase [Acidobacteriota bacterium]
MIGRRLLHYDVLDKFGEGGMGAVYKARDRRLDRLVALKFLTRLLEPPEAGRALLLREAKAISALSHPNIATIFDVEEVDGETFLVLEYLPGPTLRSKIVTASAAGRGLPFSEVIGCVSQMAQGLAHAHRRGIIHRDVKPGNAIFSAEGLLKLTDFGLAKLLSGPQITRPGTLMGTVSYMSPEQAEGRPTDARTDVFSLGVVLYEMLAGQPPFQGEHESAVLYQIVHAAPPPLARFRPGVPPCRRWPSARVRAAGATPARPRSASCVARWWKHGREPGCAGGRCCWLFC